MRVRDVALYALVVVLAAIAGLASAHAPLAAPLGGLSLLVTTWLVGSLAHGTPLRRAVVAVSVALAALIGLGYLLEWSPWGLTRRTWSVGWGCFAIAVLAVSAIRLTDAVLPRLRLAHLRKFVPIVAGIALVTTGIAVARHSADAALQAPTAVSVDRVTLQDVTVSLTTEHATGRLELVASQATGSPTVVWTTTRAAAGATLDITVPFPTKRTTFTVRGLATPATPLQLVLDPAALQARLGIHCTHTRSNLPIARAAACAWLGT